MEKGNAKPGTYPLILHELTFLVLVGRLETDTCNWSF